jgi:hypothetical protein
MSNEPVAWVDRELLELAAKAAGIEYGVIHDEPRIKFDAGWTPWNPLTDDGDALRLAVKRQLNFSDSALWLQHNDQTHYDPFAATRRVIVRAAAEIGRNMK